MRAVDPLEGRLTKKQVAAILACSKAHVDRLDRDGLMPQSHPFRGRKCWWPAEVMAFAKKYGERERVQNANLKQYRKTAEAA